ncbi:MAG: hypothetical protein OH319_03770 [Candidatus Parvarchaeota archaeon]|nr:hypothetical protein [Candidatus Jingweiarchaeum tengchongense]MCW1298599.1 hypothetical protein [Candidatus Jingweiarchaeum tengchongense]MCW1300445.1 hypothetical protein [Candidatus Jingweiarchaeum tengchongense]MCW1304623.1 hypothetical protein [Candidatus Jingweiarchaeum tengchongense]MCW1305999.1 hypothetical protein [Candidatus Jingweiarchaeum tengchongense]
MKKMNFIFLLFLIILIFNFGCTNQGVSQNQTVIPQGIYGLVITSFSTTRDTIGKNETVTLTLTMLNNGDEIASGINATLLGFGAFNITESRLNTNTARPNGTVYVIWRIKAPSYKVINSMQARIFYDYSTEGYVDALFVNESLFRTCSACTYGSERGPLPVNLSTDNPIVIHEDTGDAPFTLVINLKNTGKGKVFNDNINSIVIEVPKDVSIVSHNCPNNWGEQVVGEVKLYTYNASSNLFDPCTRLVSADYLRIRMEMNHPRAHDGLVTRIKVRVNYRYQIDSNFLRIEVTE